MYNIYDYKLEELEDIFKNLTIPKFRAKQVWNFLYKNLVDDFEKMHNLPKGDIKKLKENFNINTTKLKIHQKSKDGTQKALLTLKDNQDIETVLMKYKHGYSVCVTTQVGCKIGCSFCASHLGGFKRNLSSSEIVEQIMFWEKILVKKEARVDNIVVMGIGEPFDNLDNVLKFIDIVNDDRALNIGARKITISTSGIVPKFKQFIEYDKQINLAVSLHAPNDKIRSKIMKINDVYNIEMLLKEVKDYLNKKNRQVTFEYILLDSINDTKDCAYELATLIGNLNIHVNLIPYNSVFENGYKKSQEDKIKNFEQVLELNGISVSVRQQKGSDIDGACGQLRSKGQN